MKRKALAHRFVENIPEQLDEGVLYVSLEYATALHRCACGCGKEVVTPLSPTDWQLQFDGESVTLAPSIGNWSFPCRSHYFVRRGRVVWASAMSQRAIEEGRAADRLAKAKHFSSHQEADLSAPASVEASTTALHSNGIPQEVGWWDRLLRWLAGRG